jgi:DNA-binding sugar fermentation-stimulating protein
MGGVTLEAIDLLGYWPDAPADREPQHLQRRFGQ